MSNNLSALYVFFSSTTSNTYVMSLTLQPLTSNIPGYPGCNGYPVSSGTFTVIPASGTPTQYNIPGGATPFIYNGIWPNAADCPDGTGTPLCAGIDRLFVNFSQTDSNTLVTTTSTSSVSVVFNSTDTDTAQLLMAESPTQ